MLNGQLAMAETKKGVAELNDPFFIMLYGLGRVQ